MNTPRLAAIAASLALSGLRAHAQPSSAAAVAAAERAFAKLSLDSGQYVAFRANLDSTAIVFRPRATNGAAWYAAHPPRGPQGTLFWTPAFVGVAASNDLAFSTGPYRVDARRPNDDSVHAGGVFATVWARRGGVWRVLVDLGVGDTIVPTIDASREPGTAHAGARSAGAMPNALAEVLRADSALGTSYAASADGLAPRAADDARLLRDGAGVAIGRAAAASLGARAGAGYRSVPIAGGASAAGDLAYTYGTYEHAGPNDEGGNYLRVWRRERDGWRIVLDVASAVSNGS